MSLPNYNLIVAYNANNQRVSKLINNQIVEKYLWLNLTTLLAIYDKDDNLKQRFVYADERMPIAYTDNNDNIYYLSYNHQGSLKAITDQNGQVIKAVTYSSFGEVITDTNPNLNIPFGFAGGLYDKDTKLTRFGYRDYDSYTGRWTAKDPIDFEGGSSNLYGYVMNDPVNFIDPTGEFAWVAVAIGVAVVIAIVNYYDFGTHTKAAQNIMPQQKQPIPNQSREDILWNDIQNLQRQRQCLPDALDQVSKAAQAIQPSPIVGIPLKPAGSIGTALGGEVGKQYGK
jgi:RHS repeat-associated protein